MFDFYKTAISEAVDACEDLALLDLVWKMLASAKPTTPAGCTALEVRTSANNSRDTRLHRDVAIQICGGSAHPDPIHSKVGDRSKQVPGVCGGADSLPRAA